MAQIYCGRIEKCYQPLKASEREIGDTGSFHNWSAWQVFQKVNLGFSIDLDKDKKELRENIEKAI